MFKPNVGKTDRIIRIVAGLALLSLVFILQGPDRWVGLVGIVPLISGLSGFCLAYALCRCSSCKTEAAPATPPETDEKKSHKCGCGHAH